MTDRRKFFNAISGSLFNGRLTQGQRDGMEVKLLAFEAHAITDIRWRAYMLATSYHETGGTMQPVEEKGRGAGRPYGQKRKQDGSLYTYPDRLYYGRGDVQLTWYENYERMGKLLGYPLLIHPHLALDPHISVKIMIEGMTRGCSNRGDFTGVSLEDYFNHRKDDPVNARRVVNGVDQAHRIAGFYDKFLAALRGAMVVLLLLLVGCRPARTVSSVTVTEQDCTLVRQQTDSLQSKEQAAAAFQSQVQRESAEWAQFASEEQRHEIHYHPSAPIDSITGKPPVLLEVVTTMRKHYEKRADSNETSHGATRLARDRLTDVRRNEQVAVHAQNSREVTHKERQHPVGAKRNLCWIVLGVVLVLCVLRLYRCLLARHNR